MPKAFKGTVAVLGIVILGVATYSYFAFADQRRVQKSLRELERKISEPLGNGLDIAMAGATIKPLFMPEVSIAILRNGHEWRRDFGRDELLHGILAIKQRNSEIVLNLDFSRRDVRITGERMAEVNIMVKVENFSELVEPQRLTFTLEKDTEGNWKLAAVNSSMPAL